MAEENQDQNSADAAEQNVAPEESTQAVQEEKLLKQSEVNKLVGGVKVDAYEKGRRDAVAELERQRKTEEPKAAPATSTTPDQVTMSHEELKRVIEQEASAREEQVRLREEQKKAEVVVNQFVGKMKLGMEKHPDFEEVVTKLDIPNMPPQIVDWANSMDNTADIMYEIGKNPSKFANVLTLSVTSPRLAYDELMRLSDSIKKNEDAIKQGENTQVAEPLDQRKHSTAGVNSGKKSTVSDFRAQPWLRG